MIVPATANVWLVFFFVREYEALIMITPKSKASLRTFFSLSFDLWTVSLDHEPLDHVSGSCVSGFHSSGSCLWTAYLWIMSLGHASLDPIPQDCVSGSCI